MQQIPDEIVQLILSFSTCSLNEYATISLVSKQFHTTVTSDLFWKPLWTNLYPHSENYVRDDFYATYISTRRQQCEDPLFYAYNKKQGRLNDIKLIVLGADGVGKSTLTVQYVNGVFITEYDPTIEDVYTKIFQFEGRRIHIPILDTVEQPGHFSVPKDNEILHSQACMLVFSLTDADTLYYCEGYVESAKRANAEMVLVGSKNDLPSTISDEQVNEFMEKHNIRKYYKTSANTKENVDNAFEYLIYRSLYKMHKHIQVWSGVTQVCDERKPARVQKKCLLM